MPRRRRDPDATALNAALASLAIALIAVTCLVLHFESRAAEPLYLHEARAAAGTKRSPFAEINE
jgi:hypothetical protein